MSLPPLAKSSKGQFVTAALDSPFTPQIGDKVVQEGTTISFIRAGVVVATREASGVETVLSDPTIETNQEITGLLFFRSNPVAGTVTTLNGVSRNDTTGAITFRFANGTSREFAGLPEALSEVEYLDTDAVTGEDMLILKTIRNSPDGADLSNMIGGSVAIDFNGNIPFSLIQE